MLDVRLWTKRIIITASANVNVLIMKATVLQHSHPVLEVVVVFNNISVQLESYRLYISLSISSDEPNGNTENL